MNRLVLCLAIPISIGIASIVWRSDWFQIQYDEKNFYSKKISNNKEQIVFYEKEVMSCYLNLKNIVNNSMSEIIEYMANGASHEEAVDMHRSYVSTSTEVCNAFSSVLDETRAALKVYENRYSALVLDELFRKP